MHDEISDVQKMQGIWRTFDAANELPGGIYCLLQDHRGYLWLGTSTGLYRYNGAKFTSYTVDDGLSHDDVHDIFEDKNGTLWIGTRGGLSCFDGKAFINYTNGSGLPDDPVLTVCRDSMEQLWLGTMRHGIFCFDGERFRNYGTIDGLPSNYIRIIREDGKGQLWFGTLNGLSRFDGKHFKTYTTAHGLAANDVWTLYEDRHAGLWIGTQAGVSYLKEGKFTNYYTEDGLVANNVRGIYEDSNGILWFGTRCGVSQFDGSEFTNYTTEHGLLDNRVKDIVETREGFFWFSHPFSGLTCFDPQTVKYLTAEPVTEALIQDAQGRLWFGNENKLCCLSKGKLRWRTYDATIFGLLEDSNGAFWIALEGGLYRYSSTEDVWNGAEKRFTIEDGLGSDTALSLLESRDGTIWVGTNHPGHLCRLDGETFEAIPTQQSAILRMLEDSQGRIWMGGPVSGGLSCYDGQKLTNYNVEHGLPSNAVKSISEDDAGHLWVGTQKGLCHFDGKQFIAYGKERGLFSIDHQWSVKDFSGKLWFGTLSGGIYRTDCEHFQTLTVEDGLPSNSVTGLLPQSDGSMIIGTYRGIAQYNSPIANRPRIEVKEVIAGHVYTSPEELELTANEADLIIISYQGLSFATRRMRYSFILEGHNTEWQDTWNEQARYENLAIGEYTFKVVAINRDLIRSESPATVKLTIVPDRWSQLQVQYEAEISHMKKLLEVKRHVSLQETISDTARAIVDGLRELGFDRAAIWLCHGQDARNGSLHGLWGTNMDGEVYDNTHEILPSENIICNYGYNVKVDRSTLKAKLGIDESSTFLLKDREEELFRSIWGYPPPFPGFYERSERGENICLCAAMEEKWTVVIAVDNYITRRPIDETQANLLAIVGTEMGKVLANVALREFLAKSEAKSKAILDAIPDLMFRISRDGIFLDYKSSSKDELYIPFEEIAGSSVKDVLPPELADLTMHHIREALDSGIVQSYEYQLAMPNGMRSYESRLVANGENEALAIIRDITERKLAEEKEKEYIRNLASLSRVAMGFVELTLEDNIYDFIGKNLREFAGDSIVVILEFDNPSDTFYIRSIQGFDKHTEAILNLIGRDPIGESFRALAEERFALGRGKLHRLQSDINDVTGGMVSKKVVQTLKKIPNLGDIYSMGFTTQGKLSGVALVCLRKGKQLENQDIIETFINQASVALLRRKAEEQIKASLAEKEVLLKEIHHRVKNNSQIISSLLNLQSDYIKDERFLKMFGESQNRVRSMALIHEKLYQSGDLARINFADYIRDLTSYLFRMYKTRSHEVKLEISIDDILLDMDTAIPCGLIINELISNSLKHGFPADDFCKAETEPGGKVRVELRPNSDGKLTLIVSDNGVGFPEDLDIRNTESLGLQLVETLTEQLDGIIELDISNGTVFEITFAGPC